MKNKFLAVLVSALALVLFTNTATAQAPFKYLTYIFPADSLKGFDEEAAKQEALSRGFFGSEYHVIMYSMKRDFINKKYGYYTGPGANAKGTNPVINAAPCVNEDFESSPSTTSTSTVGTIGTSLLGWTASWGQNSGINGSCTQSGCCPSAGSTDAWIRQTPWTAPAPLGVIPASPFGGTKVIQMNDNITMKGEVVRIQQTFPVTPSNALFQFAYKACLNGSGHTCCDQPYIRVELLDCMNNILACPQVSITAPGPSCATAVATGWSTNTSGISWTPNWIIKAIDLSPYLGSCVTIKVTVGDCDGWAHYGYAFFDFQCLPMTVTVNNIQFPAGSAVVGVAACGVSTGTMTAPPGLAPYSWTGPAGSGITNNPNQTVTTNVAGNYTLTMNPPGICTPITKTVNLQFGSFPNAGVTTANSCTTYTLTNTGTAAPSVQTYSFAGPGAPSSFTTTNPTSVINFAPSTTYTIYQTVTNPQNCPATASVVITTPPGPSPAFTAAPSWTQCLQGNAFTFNANTNPGTHAWSFSPSAGAPAPGSGSTYGPVNFTSAGTYTVMHTITNSGCVSSTQSVVVVNTAPTASILTAFAPPCAGASATLTGAGGPGTLSWAGPNGWTGVGLNATVPNFQTVNNGVYTLTVNNFGCKTTKTATLTLGVQPTPTLSNSGPVCLGSPITFSATFPPGASYYYWYRPTPYYYGGYNNANPTIAVTTTATAGNYIFYLAYPGCPVKTYTSTVQIISAASLTVTNTGPYCVGQNIQLNVVNSSTAAATYTWTGPSSFTSNIQNPSIPNATTTMGGVYTVSTSIGSCKSSKTTTVVVNTLPVIVVNNPTVCLGQTINLTSSGGTSYSWSGPNGFTSTLQNPSITNSTTNMAGVYTVTVTNAGGCKNTATLNVTVNTPTTTASNTGPFCVGTTIQLNTPAAGSYAWSGPGGFTSNLQNPTIPGASAAMGGVYTVTATTGGCMATATTSVTMNALPIPAPSNTGAYCLGANIQLNVGAYTSYTWSGPGSFSSNSQNPGISSAALSNAGSYSVAVTDANGCIGGAATNVVVNPLPTPVVNSPTTCENTTIGLTATGGTAFAWSGPGGYSSTTQNPNIPSATTSMTGNYTVTVTDANGCVNTGVASVSVIALPIPTAATGGAVCDGATLNLSSNGGTSYSWTGPNGFSSASQNPNIPAATLAAGGIYTVVVTANTCTAAATVSATINPLPNPNIITNSPICVGQGLNLNGTGGISYSWTGPNGFTSTSQNPNVSSTSLNNGGNYVLTVTDANGCVNTTNTNVTINPLPNASATGGSACENMNTSLSANGGATYTWSGPNGFSSNLQNPTITNAQFAANGQYTVVVTSAAGCVSMAFASVVVNPAPVPQIITNSPICVNNILNLTATGGVSYNWTGPNGFGASVATATINANTTLYSGNYQVLVTDANGCQASTSANAVINPLPIPNVTALNNTGCSPVCATFNLTSNSPIVSSSWTMGDGSVASGTSVNACYATTGIYTITATVTDVNGCSNTAQNFSEVYPTPVADFNHAPLKPVVNVDQEVTFTDASHGATISNWNWYFNSTAQFTSNLQNPTFMYTEPGTYAVALVVKSDKGCIDTIVRQLVVGEDYGVYVPNAFSPNGDGLNDIFQPKGFGIVKYEIQIFDRWGEKVFQTKNFEQGWDGKFQGRGGEVIEEGSYTWLINVTSVFGKAHELKGHVTLIK